MKRGRENIESKKICVASDITEDTDIQMNIDCSKKQKSAPVIQDSDTPYCVDYAFSLKEEIDNCYVYTVLVSQFCVEIKYTSTEKNQKWYLKDLNGHSREPNKKVHGTYHFEITCGIDHREEDLELDVVVSLQTDSQCFFDFRVEKNLEEHAKLSTFIPWTNNCPREYRFEPTHEVIYETLYEGREFAGFAFSMRNCDIAEKSAGPDWQLEVDMGAYMESVIPKQFIGLKQSPLRADYGQNLESWERAQGAPFWEMWRHGKIRYTVDCKSYEFVPYNEWIDIKFGQRKRWGGSGAYKWAGKRFKSPMIDPDTGKKNWVYINTDPTLPVEGNWRMRIGSILEESVELAFLLETRETKIMERGWVDYPHPTTEQQKLWGTSPDGLIWDPSMKKEDVPDYRRKSWEDAGHSLDSIENFSLGLLEVKVSTTNDKMMDYYRMQCIWSMMIMNLYWTRLIKLNKTTGVARVYTMFRDFSHEAKLVNILKATHARVETKEDFYDAITHYDNEQFVSLMGSSAWWFNKKENLKWSTELEWSGRKEVQNYLQYKRKSRQDVALCKNTQTSKKKKKKKQKKIKNKIK